MASFGLCRGAGEPCFPLARLRERETLGTFLEGVGEAAAWGEGRESVLDRRGRAFLTFFSTSAASLEAAAFCGGVSALAGESPRPLKPFSSLTGELSTESLWSTKAIWLLLSKGSRAEQPRWSAGRVLLP